MITAIVVFLLLACIFGTSESKYTQVQTMSVADYKNACMYYRHDFGLLSYDERERMLFQAKAWDIALGKAIEDKHGRG